MGTSSSDSLASAMMGYFDVCVGFALGAAIGIFTVFNISGGITTTHWKKSIYRHKIKELIWTQLLPSLTA